MADCVVEKREAGYYVRNSLVSLDNLVYLWREGAGDESIRDSYPTLEMDEVAGALRFYFDNRPEIDAWMEDCERREQAILSVMRSTPQTPQAGRESLREAQPEP